MGLDEMVEFGQVCVDARKLFWTKRGNSFCRQIFIQAVFTLFSTVLADMRALNSCCSLSTLSTSWFTIFSVFAECDCSRDCSRIDLFTSVVAFVQVFFESLVSTKLRGSHDL